MHNTVGRAVSQLGTFSGIISLADPRDVPRGGSPRNQNADFIVGKVRTRGSLTNPFTYANNDAGPSPGHLAADVSLSGNAWTNVGNVLTSGTYAQSSISLLSLAISQVQVVLVSGVYYTVVTFTTTVPTADAGQKYSFSGLTTHTSLNGQVLGVYLGSGGPTLTAYQQAFQFGSAAYGPASDTGSASVSDVFVGTDAIDITEFAFSIASSKTPQGFKNAVYAYAPNGATLHAQMLKAGVPVGTPETVTIPATATDLSIGGINDLFGASWVYSDINNTQFGIRLWATGTAAGSVYVGYTTIASYFLPILGNFNYVTTFEDDFGNIYTLAIDDTGQWWIEDVLTSPGVLSPLVGGPPAGSFASSFTADSRQYWATSNLLAGNYPPQQYNGQWNDRVSQVGPGQAPTFIPISSSSNSFNITSITQPADYSHSYAYFLQSTGPGSTSPGSVVTIYDLDSTVAPGPNSDLVNAFNSGYPVYMWLQFTGGGGGIGTVNYGPAVVLVTSVGLGKPPGQPRPYYYFTFDVTSIAYNFTDESSSANVVNYQRSLATMTMAEPVPGLTIGNKVTISGSSVTSYDNTWPITQTPNSGTFTITETVVSGGIATYSYSLINGTAPAAGQLVTITGTNNDNGQLNLVNATIASSTGGSTGTFTINVSLPDATAATEEGQAVTAGTVFCFDPGGVEGAGSITSPIYGNATGGSLTFAGTGQYVSPGTRKGTVFFITRNGYWTAPAPPVTFSAAGDTITGIQANNIPIGPPNVIARAIVFTEAGALGVPGANYYTIPDPVEYIVNDVTYTTDSLFINDNTTTSATFFFTDAALLSATEIDIQGNDLFALAEIGDSAWCTQYAGRTVWGRVNNKIQNFLNLSFDGGYLANPSGGNLYPLGWSVDQSTIVAGSEPTLLDSPVFGNSLYLHNQSGATVTAFGRFFQSAYEDWELASILQNQTAYSVRVTCRTPASATVGSLVIDLCPWDATIGFGTPIGAYTLPLTSMSSTMATYSGTLLATNTLNIPSDLQLRVWASGLGNGADIEIDRIEIFPTEAPINLTGLTFSYLNDPESFDQITGGNDTSTLNAQPANGAFVMHGTLYVVKESSLGFFKDTPNQEPANWQPFEEVSNVAGASGINAFDVGEEWAVMACQNGIFLFNGGQPIPIQLEVPDLWQSINWEYGHTICVRNDVANRRILFAVPLPTPNNWMVDTTVNSNPTTPNVILMLNYKGIADIEQLMAASPMHVTLMGKLAIHDLRRKWSLWTIPTPYMGMVKRNELFSEMLFCNGIQSSKIYYLDENPSGYDDGVAFTSSYCTYGCPDTDESEMNPLFGQFNKRYAYWDILAQGSGNLELTFWQNDPTNAPYPFTVPGGLTLTPTAPNDYEGPLNVYGQRVFTEWIMKAGWFNVSRVTLALAKDRWAANRGVAK